MESGFAGPRRAWEGSHLPSGWRPCHRLLGELQERSAKRRFRHAPWSVIGDGSGSQWELARASAMRCSRRTISQGPSPDNATCARPHTGHWPVTTGACSHTRIRKTVGMLILPWTWAGDAVTALVHGDGRGARRPRKMVQSVMESKQNPAIFPEFRHVNDRLPTHDRARERTD